MKCSLCGVVLSGTLRAACDSGWRVVTFGTPRQSASRIYCPTHDSRELLRDRELMEGKWVSVRPKPDRRGRVGHPVAPPEYAEAAN